MHLVQTEVMERQTIAMAEFSELDLGGMVQSLHAVVADQQVALTVAEAATARWDVLLSQLTSEELEDRLAMMQAEHSALGQHQEQYIGWVQMQQEHHAQRLAVERQESLGRLELAAEARSDVVGLAGQLPAVAGQLAEVQSAAQASREQMQSLQEALEERELAISRLGRDLEALQDAQAVMDAAGQQREVGRLEAERREAILGEQRAAWSTLQAFAQISLAGEMQQARMAPQSSSSLPHYSCVVMSDLFCIFLFHSLLLIHLAWQ